MTASASTAAVPEPRQSGSSAGDLVVNAVLRFPDRFGVWCVCAVLAVTVCLQLNAFHPYTVFPIFVALVVASWKMVPSAPSARSAGVQGAIGVAIALAMAIAFVLYNRQYYSELLYIGRDPAIYTLRGFWLMNHASPDVTITQQMLDLKKSLPAMSLDFGAETGRLVRYMQSTTLVPGFLGIAGWIGGASLLLQAGMLIAGGALIAIYAIARRLAGPLLGLLPVAAIGLGMPMVAFSRSTYTEPISLLVTMVALLGLWAAWRERRAALWVLAGSAAGAAQIARIDGALVVVGAIVGMGLLGGLASSTEVRRAVLAGLGWFCLGAFPMLALGLNDLRVHSPDYLRVLSSRAYPLLAAVLIVAVVALIVTVFKPLRLLGSWLQNHHRGLGTVLGVLAAAAAVIMALRPLFIIFRHATRPYSSVIGGLQRREHLPIDPTRSYDEMSINALSWYFGWPAVITAGVAAVAVVVVVARQRLAQLLLVATPIGTTSLLYINYISIAPDQIWEMRRFLPVILPGMMLMVAWGLAELTKWTTRSARVPAVWRRPVVAVVTLFAAMLAIWPQFTWGIMHTERESAGRYDAVAQVCEAAQGRKILMAGAAFARFQPAFRNVCDVESVWLAEASPANLAKVVAGWQPGEIVVVTQAADDVSWTQDPGKPPIKYGFAMWDTPLSHRPDSVRRYTDSIWIGIADSDGRVTALGKGER